ncbi:MAG TPA: hypothetical protein VH682_31700 [Gemmataceae bacterium]
MNTPSDTTSRLRRMVYVLLIAVATAMVLGRILSAELVYEPTLSRNWPDDPGHPRRPWPATAPRAMPTFSSNDRSRWAAVRALVDQGTWVVGRRDKQVVIASAPAALAARDPLQLAVLLEAGYERRIKSDSGIIFEDGWQSVDKMLDPATLEYYSTKPPLLTFLAAGEYWVLKKAFGWSLQDATPGEERDERFAVVRVGLIAFNVVPFVVYLWLLARLAERFGATDWGRLFVVAAACFGTLVTPFLITLNNHTLATCSILVAVYATVRIQSSPSPQPSPPGGGEGRVRGWRWFVLAGFFAGFTAVNELPAFAFVVGLGLHLLVRFPRRTLLAFVPAVVLPVAALLALNYAELGNPWDIGYSKFGGPWYEYEGSHWRNLPDQSKRGIDWAKNKEGRGAYAFNLLLGHHGWLALTPVYLLGLGGMGWGVRCLLGGSPPQPQPPSPRVREKEERSPNNFSPEAEERIRESPPLTPSGEEGLGMRESEDNQLPPRLWTELAVSTLLLSLVVIGYYIFKSDNYGGWTNGPRWLMWLSPLWLLAALPIADRLGRCRWGRALCIILLVLSVLSAHYWDWNPWRHPWIYNWMDARGWVPY